MSVQKLFSRIKPRIFTVSNYSNSTKAEENDCTKKDQYSGFLKNVFAYETIIILGSGDLGQGLLCCLTRRGYRVVVASRNPDKKRARIESIGGEIENYADALLQGNIVIVAVPFKAFGTLPVDLLEGKIVIDVSNRPLEHSRDCPSLAYQLQKLLPGSKVVKAFNTLSAYGLQNNLFQGSKEVPICSDDEEAKMTVTALVRNLGFIPVNRGNLSSATEIEEITLAFFPHWKLASKIALGVFSVSFLIIFFRSQLCPNFEKTSKKGWDWKTFEKFPLVTVHGSFACTAITLLSLCYLPGVIAGYIQLYRRTKYSEFPKWLDVWLRSRKQIGLLTQVFASMHTLMAILDVIRRGIELWLDYTYLSFGCFAIGLMTILAITSLPSVSESLTWREFSFVQRYLGWWALGCAVLHLIFKKWSKLISNSQRCVVIPDAGQIFILLPLITIILKLILILPCIDRHIQKIRRGIERESTEIYPA